MNEAPEMDGLDVKELIANPGSAPNFLYDHLYTLGP